MSVFRFIAAEKTNLPSARFLPPARRRSAHQALIWEIKQSTIPPEQAAREAADYVLRFDQSGATAGYLARLGTEFPGVEAAPPGTPPSTVYDVKYAGLLGAVSYKVQDREPDHEPDRPPVWEPDPRLLRLLLAALTAALAGAAAGGRGGNGEGVPEPTRAASPSGSLPIGRLPLPSPASRYLRPYL